MKTWYHRIYDHLDEAGIYGFTVLCTFFGDYILHKTRPEVGWLPLMGAMLGAALVCLAVEVLSGATDTDIKKSAKRKNFPKRLLISGLAGTASGAVLPVMIKTFMASIGVNL